MPKRLPHNIAMEILLLGRRMSAQEAHHYGMVNKVVPKNAAMDAAREWADIICTGAPLTIQGLKECLREMDGKVAEAMATPNSPRGSCMKRNAYPSQLTGPSPGMRDAKFVFTITLICTAAFPRMAGPIMRKILCSPGWLQLKSG